MRWIYVNVLMFTLHYMDLHLHRPCIGRAAMGFVSHIMFFFASISIYIYIKVKDDDNKPWAGFVIFLK